MYFIRFAHGFYMLGDRADVFTDAAINIIPVMSCHLMGLY